MQRTPTRLAVDAVMNESIVISLREKYGSLVNTRPSERPGFVRAMLAALTVIFWGSVLIFMGLMVLYAVTKSVGTVSTWTAGISLSLMAVSSGCITWIESRNNPLDDTERGEWTNKMLFYGLACVFSFIVACLYVPALYFAP